ncbi:hypothetical protein ACFQPF_02280 [Fictibacillus iocasae]|uniref:YhhN-like protein n=1 Tax=Fictibacillus iocasae TaxID=2715437 RepID=A0ABW2NMR3_9BACL
MGSPVSFKTKADGNVKYEEKNGLKEERIIFMLSLSIMDRGDEIMNDGIIFYMAAWCAFIYFTFIHKKNDARLKWAISILAAILLSGHEIVLGDVTIGLTLVGLFICSLFSLHKHAFFQMLRVVMVSFMIMMLYVLLHVYFLYDPAMLIAPSVLLIGMIAAAASVGLGRTESEALHVCVTGLILGDMLLQVAVLPLKGYIEAGGKEFLDVASISFCSLYVFFRTSLFIKSVNRMKTGRKITLKR